MNEEIEDLKERFGIERMHWKIKVYALENKGLKVNTRKTKVMLSGSEGELFKSKIVPVILKIFDFGHHLAAGC